MDWRSAFPVVVRQDESGPCLMCTHDRSRFLATSMSHRKHVKASNSAVKVDVAVVAGGRLLRYRTDEAFADRRTERRSRRPQLSSACEEGLEAVRKHLLWAKQSSLRPVEPGEQDDEAGLDAR